VIKDFQLLLMLGWQDVKQAYRRSSLGPFWITLGMSVQIATIGIVFGLIFRSDLAEFLPFLATSLIFWGLLSTVLSESTSAFVSSEALIKQLKIPFYVYIFRGVWKNLIVLGHNVVILPVVFLAMAQRFSWEVVLVVPGLILFLTNLSWMATVLAIVSTRYRDVQQITSSFLTVAFYLTPVIWYPQLLPGGSAHLLLGLNPLYHLMQIVRLPVLGEVPTFENWILSLAFAIVGWLFAHLVYQKYRNRIAYWV